MLFILNSDLQIINTLSMKGDITRNGSTPYFEDYYKQLLETGAEVFEFKTMANSKESESLVVGNYIAFRDDNGDDKLFNIIETSESKGSEGFIKYVYCEMHGIELRNSVVRPIKITNANVGKFAETILSDSDWALGRVDDFGELLDIEISEHMSVYEVIQKYIIGEYKAEIYYTVKIKGNNVVNKYLNIVKSRGFDEGLRFTYDKNMQDITRTIDVGDLCTALIGVGNNGLTFKGVEAEDKPLNQDYIVSEDAYKQWSVNGYHIFGYENFETDNPQELLKLTRAKLKERCNPKVKYELNVELLNEEVGIGDYVRITDMEFEPAITLGARINVLTKSKTDVNGNTCEISNFVQINSNITEEMRKLSSSLKGYLDNANIDNINKGGFLTSRIDVVDENTLKINNNIPRGRNFCLEFKHLKAEPILTNLEIPTGTVMQQFMIDYHENKIYIAYDETGNGKLILLQLDMSGKILGRMNLHEFDHGNTMGIERRGDKTYIWTSCDGKQAVTNAPEKLRGTKICYFQFKDGVTATKTYGKVIDILPGWKGLTVAVDDSYNQLAVRAMDKISGTSYFHIYDLKSVIDNKPKLIKKIKDVPLVGTSGLQGYDILGDYIYKIQGTGYYDYPAKLDTYVTCLNINTGKIRYTQLIDILPEMKYREAEGIKIVKRSDTKFELMFGLCSETERPRKNNIFKYTEIISDAENPLGKFIHPNGSVDLIEEGLIAVDSSKKRNYLMHVIDGERFNFDEGYSKQIILANYDSGSWYCNGELFNPMENDCIIGYLDKNENKEIKLTIYAESSSSVGGVLSSTSDGLIYENGKVVITAGSLVGVLPSDLIEVEGIRTEHLKADSITSEKIQANSIDANHIKAGVITGDKIEGGTIIGDNIQGNTITGDKIHGNTITGNHIQAGTITGEHIKAGTITGDKIEGNTIIGEHIHGNTITGGHIKGDTITGNHIQGNTITGNHITSGAITAGSTIIGEGAIGSAQISSLDAAKITAGKIDTSKVEVAGANSHLRIKGNRLQVFHGLGNQAVERVSLGDVNGDGTIYGFRVRGKDGQTVLIDENGVKSEGITDGSITNDKISDNADIDGAKININSVVNKINQDGTESIKGTKIEVDGTSLTTKLSSITIKQNEDSERISQAQSQITANTDAIKLKVDEQIYQTDKTDMTSKLDKNTSEIEVLKNEISLKVEHTDIENAINKATLTRADFIARNFLSTPLIVSDSTLPIYALSGIPNPPEGAVFGGFNQENNTIKNNSISSNGTAWAIVVGYEFYKNTTDDDKKNKIRNIIKKVADFMANNVSVGRFNSMDFNFIDTNYKYDNASQSWVRTNYKEIYISTLWLQVKAMVYAYEILKDDTYLNLCFDILDSLFNTHFYMNAGVKSKELPSHLEWASYEYLACDNLATNRRFVASTRQYANQMGYYIHQAIPDVIRVFGDNERTTPKGDKYKPSDILVGLKKYLKNAYDTQNITAKPLGLPYGYFHRVENESGGYDYIPQNWDFIKNIWGDVWFVGDVVTYTIYAFAASGLTDIAREYADNYYKLRVNVRDDKWSTRFNDNELVFFDRMDFHTGTHLPDDDSISITYTSLYYEILKQIGKNEHIDACCYTLAKHQINNLDNKNIDGGYPWDISKDGSSLEFKSFGEIINSQFYKNLNITSFSSINNRFAEIKVTTDAITQNVTQLSSKVETKADGSTVTEISNKVSSLETGIDGITGKVSSLESTTTTLNGQMSDVQSIANSANSTANINKGNITNLQGEVTNIKTSVASLEVTTSGISQKVSSVESTTTTLTGQISSVQSTATNAINKANSANSLADSKAKVFTTTPTTPYKIGDLWAKGKYGDLYRCIVNRASGVYVSSDWEKATSYTDDTKANIVDNKVDDLKVTVNSTSSKVASIETNLSNITSKVESVESTQTTINGKVTNLETWKKSAEQKITDSAIINTVKASRDENGKNTFAQQSDITQLNNSWTAKFNDGYNQGITTINKDGITVASSGVKSKTSMSASGFKITKTDTNEDVFSVKSNGTLSIKGTINSGSTINGSDIRGGTLTIGNTSEGNFFKINEDGSFQAGSVDQWNYKATITYGNSGFYVRAWDDANSKSRTTSIDGDGVMVGTTLYSDKYISANGGTLNIIDHMKCDGNIVTDGYFRMGNSSASLQAKDTSGTLRTLAYISGSDNSYFGKGLYDAGIGGTIICGNDVTLRSKNDVIIQCGGTTSATNTHTIEFTSIDGNGFFRPTVTNATRLGSLNYLWNIVYSKNGVNQSSDRNLKENIRYIDENLPNKLAKPMLEKNDLTSEALYNFVKDDLFLAKYNFIGEEEEKIGFIAQDLLYNTDGTDNKIGQIIVSAKDSAETNAPLSYNMGNYVNVLAGALKQAILKIEELEKKLEGMA